LAKLRQEDRLILAYRLFFDLSEAEMATALNCPRGTVKSRLSRALGRLRAALPADFAVGEANG
jgi:RNA polymerase sigma-70 factor (ECF subfamily)